MANSIINKIGGYFGVEGTFANWFVIIGIVTQLLTYYIMNDSALAVCSGIAGVISVVLCSQKKYAFYFWGILQLVTIMIISYQSGLHGKLVENAFYLITMFIGMNIWKENTTNNTTQVRTMDWVDYVIFGCIFLPFATILSYSIVSQYNTEQIALDIITTIIGIIAQIMLILRFREQWLLWFVLDILCILLWVEMSNWCLVAQYIFWAINCIYGYFYWYYVKE